jgi:hypothetical protein
VLDKGLSRHCGVRVCIMLVTLEWTPRAQEKVAGIGILEFWHSCTMEKSAKWFMSFQAEFIVLRTWLPNLWSSSFAIHYYHSKTEIQEKKGYLNHSKLRRLIAVVLRTATRRPSRTDGRMPLLLLLVGRGVGYPDDHPVAQELAENGAQDDGDEDVAIEVHDQQHDNVGQTKSNAVDDGPDQLLQRGGTEGGVLDSEGRRGAVAAVCGRGSR